MNRKSNATPGYGGSSLMVIFGVLVLSVFALLSLATAQADKRLSDASAQAVSAYYAADCRAEEIFAQLRAGEIPPEVQEQDGVWSFSLPIQENQQLQVCLGNNGERWQILTWQAVAQPPEISETMPVWDGELP